MSTEHILVIKHGALGDIVLASGPMKTIREHHADARLTLLTTKSYAELLKQSGWFDDIWVDCRPKLYQPLPLWRLTCQLRSRRFDRVYDLQTSSRSSWYYRLFASPKPEFSGIAEGASHRHNTPERTSMHTIDRQRQQLEIAGIKHVHAPDISWMRGEGVIEGMDSTYALLVPGGSAHRPEKRYPEAHFITLAESLHAQGIQLVLIGGGAEAELLQRIENAVPGAMNLCNKTGLGDIADLARGAEFAIGNDTGPMHIIAATECRSVVLFSHASNPELCAPRGEHVTILREPDLQTLLPERVLACLSEMPHVAA